jgi:quinolinate synthase
VDKVMDNVAEIRRLKEELGKNLVILAHYYQRDEVYQCADITGDSYALALASSRSNASHIVFCGVTFMAESARILAQARQHVYLPDFEAGCPLADMVDEAEFASALDRIRTVCNRHVVPMVYINSSAAVKAAAAGEGGIACTSSNAAILVKSFLDEGKTVFFLPDMNLGINTARALGIKRAEVAVYHRRGEPEALFTESRLIVWDGFCNVHVCFSLTDVYRAKNEYPYARVIVHPECDEKVVEAADYAGSTSGIIAEIEKAKSGDVFFVGTEQNLVRRLAKTRTDVKVFPLRSSGCVNMNKITQEKLLAAIRSIATPPSPFEVVVPPETCVKAVHAIQGMIERVETGRKQA